ncbi:GntR family transcriptional regulator [Pendulispora rubella]|uniref:GntR family transcriptional regulator n=1 Tax=Pendulispora rubella TaxID=2741070 RepID=A0ABZ2L807_9BACT
MQKTKVLEAVPRRLLRDEAYGRIRDAILDGTLEAGETIRDGDLAERLQLSRTPVREALARLIDEGLVESKPGAFTRVTPVLRREVMDAHAVVQAMHELAVKKAVPRMTRADIDMLTQANQRFADALDASDVEAALAADDEFHDIFVRASGNGAIAATIERYTPSIRRLERLRFGSLPGRASVKVHARIVRAAANQDIDTAAELTVANWATLGQLIDRALFEQRNKP